MESLQDMSLQQLNEMESNPGRLDDLVLESKELQGLQREKEMYLATNRALAEENLSFQPRLDSGRILLQEKYEVLGQAAALYSQQKEKLDSFVAKLSPKSMLPTLRDHLRIIEEESEEMAEKFLEGLIPLETFLEDFASKRRQSHQRRIRVEKLQELLKMQETTSNPKLQQSENQTQPFFQPSQAPSLVDPQTMPGPPDSRHATSFPLPYSQSPPLTGQPLPMGPVAQGDLAPAAFPVFEGQQPSLQRTFPYGPPPPPPGHHGSESPRFSYRPGAPIPGYPQPGSSNYPYPQPPGPGYPRPGGPGPGYPQPQPCGQPPYPTSSGQPPCIYPALPQFQRYPGAPQPLYPQHPGFPQPSFPTGHGWSRYPRGQ